MLNRQVQKYDLGQLHAGMIVAELMTTDDGKAILSQGTVLTNSLIRLLNQWGVERVAIQLPEKENTFEASLPWSFDRAAFNNYYKETVDLVKTAFNSISLFREVPVASISMPWVYCALLSVHSQAKKYTRQNHVALPGKCTKSACGHGLAGTPVGALAGKAGGVGAVSLHCDLIQLKMGEPA